MLLTAVNEYLVLAVSEIFKRLEKLNEKEMVINSVCLSLLEENDMRRYRVGCK